MSDARFRITYKPEGVEPRTWDVDLMDGLKASEVIAMQKVSGLGGLGPLVEGLQNLDLLAVKALLWLLLKRDLSTVPWDGLDFTLGELDIDAVDEVSDGALRARLEALDRQGTLNAAGRRRLDQLVEAGVPAEVEDPKA